MKPDRLINAFLFAALFVAVVVGWSLWRERDSYRDALAVSRKVVEQRNAMIVERDKIIQAWVDANPPGDVEDGKMGARIIPTVRNLADEAHQATIESRAILRKVDKLIDDVEGGRVGLKITGSVLRGEAHIEAERK